MHLLPPFALGWRVLIRWVVPAVIWGSLAWAGDWPQWRGPDRTGHAAADERALTLLPADPRIVWKIPAGDGFASPIVAGGRVFVADAQHGQEMLRALSVTDGRELWRTAIDQTFRDAQGPPAPRCTPVFADGRVYAQSCRGELVCVAADDGHKLWAVNYGRDFGAVFIGEKGAAPGATRHGNNGSPWVSGGFVWASAGSTNGAGMVQLDAATGAVLWKGGNETAAYAAPMYANIEGTPQIVNFMADAIVGFDATQGAVLWRYPLKTAFARHVSTPVIRGNQVLFGSHQTALIALQVGRQGDRWEAVQAWTNREAAPNFSSPVAVGDWVFTLGADRKIICLDRTNGQIRWAKSGQLTSPAEKAHAGFVVLGGQSVLMLTDAGEVVLFAVDAKEFRELGRVQVCGANWCNPAWAGGKLYVRDGIKSGGFWWCVDLQP